MFFSATTIARGLKFVCRKEVTEKRSKLGVSKISLISMRKQISGMWQFSHIAYLLTYSMEQGPSWEAS